MVRSSWRNRASYAVRNTSGTAAASEGRLLGAGALGPVEARGGGREFREAGVGVIVRTSAGEHGTVFVLGRDQAENAVPSVVLAGEHGVRLRAGRHQNRPRWQGCLATRFPAPVLGAGLNGDTHAGGMTEAVELDRERCEALGEAHALLQRLLHLLVVQRVRGAVDEALAVGDGGAAP